MSDELRAEQRRMALMALVASVLLLGCASMGAAEALGYMAPPLALFALLLLGRYPGERAMARLLGCPRRPPRRRTVGRTPSRLAVAPLPRGGALLGAALAGRAPPPVAG